MQEQLLLENKSDELNEAASHLDYVILQGLEIPPELLTESSSGAYAERCIMAQM